jgi:flagellar biosynthesis protein FlhA
VLLIATMLRLALDLACTRLILAHGHEGTGAAGHVIEAFGHFVMSGNFVVGFVVFTILLIVNFVVVAKGSGRIAEVAARFTLEDAMPGKQMAIDADLSAGLIDEQQAKARRRALRGGSSSAPWTARRNSSRRRHSQAADHLHQCHRRHHHRHSAAGHELWRSAKAFAILTVGDGLVSQVPALIVSTAAGLLVSKAGVRGSADKALVKQLATMPKALGMSAAVMAAIALMPGMPMIPFLALAGGAAWLARSLDQTQQKVDVAAKVVADEKTVEAREETMGDVLEMDDLKIEIGYGLLPLVNSAEGGEQLTEQIEALRHLRGRNGVGDAVGSHSRQCPARSEHLCREGQGGRRRPGSGVRRAILGAGPHGRAGATAGAAHRRADIRPARDLDRRVAPDEAENGAIRWWTPASIV